MSQNTKGRGEGAAERMSRDAEAEGRSGELASSPGVIVVRWVARPYGVETFYPECRLSELFCSLRKTKTLTRRDIEIIKEMGFEVRTKEIKL